MPRHPNPPAIDFRNQKKGAFYTGPDDETLILMITEFGTRHECSLAEIKRHIHNQPSFTETLEAQLARLVRWNRLERHERNGETFYRKGYMVRINFGCLINPKLITNYTPETPHKTRVEFTVVEQKLEIVIDLPMRAFEETVLKTKHPKWPDTPTVSVIKG